MPARSVQEVELQVAQENAEAAYELGILKLHGSVQHGIEQDETAGYRLLDKSAGQGFVKAQKYLDELIAKHTLTENDAASRQWIEHAADKGFSKAQTILAERYLKGLHGTEQNVPLARKWLKAALDQNNPQAQVLWERYGSSLDKVTTVQQLAEQGDIKAQLELADMYDKKLHGLADPFKTHAEYWYKQAAAQGDANAQFWLYRWGKADEQLMWFEKAVQQEHPEALYSYGLAYASEQNADHSALNPGKALTDEQMRAEALSWYEKSALKGFPRAQAAVCISHILGWGGADVNRETASAWCQKAASQGETDVLAWLVDNPAMLKKARKGAPEDQYNLARMLRFLPLTYGIIGGVQEKETYDWYVKAMEQGYKKAEEDLAEILR